MWWKNNKGFTLIECLLALIMLSGILILADGILRHVRVVEPSLARRNDREWEVCLLRLENELQGFEYLGLEKDQKICLKRPDKAPVYVEKHKNMLRIRENGGHHPILTDIKAVNFSEKQGGVLITVEFSDKSQATGWWLYP